MKIPVDVIALSTIVLFAFAAPRDEVNKVTPDSPRTQSELCEEVRVEVNLSVEAELLTQEQADRIVERCFNTNWG